MKNQPKTILLVDDDETFRSRLARAFKERNLIVHEAENHEQALSLTDKHSPEYVVLDLKLKKDYGLDILQELVDIKPSIKVMILTGYGTINTAVEALKTGAVNYLTKPTDADSILLAFENKQEEHKLNASEVPPLEQVEWDHINRVMQDFSGNITKASKALGLHRRSLQRKLNKAPNRLK